MVEFGKMLNMLPAYGGQEKNNYNYLARYLTVCLWKYHLIGQVDDTANFGMSNPKSYNWFDFAVKTYVLWSKM